MTTFTLHVEGCPPFTGLSAKQVDALVRTAREFSGKTHWGGPKIDVKKEQS